MASFEKKDDGVKKYLMSGLLIFFVLVGFSVAGYFYLQLTEETARVETVDLLAVEDKPENLVIVGVNTKSPPLKFYDKDSNLVGLDIEFLDAAFEIMGKEYRLRPMAWAEKDDLLNSKEIDLIWGGVSITEKRKKIYLMSKPYLETSILAVTAANSDVYTLQDMAGKRVAHQRGSFVKGLLESFSETNPKGRLASIEGYPSSSSAMVALLEGRLDVSTSSRASVLYYSANSPGKFRVLSEPFHRLEGLSVAGRLDEVELIGEVNDAIDQLYASGKMREIQMRWFGEVPSGQ